MTQPSCFRGSDPGGRQEHAQEYRVLGEGGRLRTGDWKGRKEAERWGCGGERKGLCSRIPRGRGGEGEVWPPLPHAAPRSYYDLDSFRS